MCLVSSGENTSDDGHSVHKAWWKVRNGGSRGDGQVPLSLQSPCDRAAVHWEDMRRTGEDDVHMEAIAIHCQCTQTTP